MLTGVYPTNPQDKPHFIYDIVDSRIYPLAVPMPRFPVVESDYGIALEKELKEARAVAKKNIEAAQ